LDKNKKLIVIGGPTASGKTDLAVCLAQKLNTAVFSADSRQIYHELNIGVARPTAEEMQGVDHHFIDHVSIKEDYSVGRYEAEVMKASRPPFS
jgi:tRNA dimethylallyltransferase